MGQMDNEDKILTFTLRWNEMLLNVAGPTVGTG